MAAGKPFLETHMPEKNTLSPVNGSYEVKCEGSDLFVLIL